MQRSLADTILGVVLDEACDSRRDSRER